MIPAIDKTNETRKATKQNKTRQAKYPFRLTQNLFLFFKKSLTNAKYNQFKSKCTKSTCTSDQSRCDFLLMRICNKSKITRIKRLNDNHQPSTINTK